MTHQLPIHELMSREVRLYPEDAPLRELIDWMQAQRHSCAIIGRAGVPTGIITERDLVRVLQQLAKNPGAGLPEARAVMSAEPCTVETRQTLFDALVIARSHRIRHLPVVEPDGRLAGIVTQTDLTRAHFQLIERQQSLIEHQIQERTRELMEANAELQSLSLEDALTGIGNRRAMEVDLAHTHATALRYGHGYSLALLDIDHFKTYNDRYGHLGGDRILKQVASEISQAIRRADRLYRYGGEEFLLLLPDTAETGALTLVRRLVRQIESRRIEHRDSPGGILTLSAGIASFAPAQKNGAPDWKDIVESADRRLYQAKQAGRNQVA